jgi:hypothetical protein
MKINNSETSLAAYARNYEKFESREAQALEVLGDQGLITSNELFQVVKETFPPNYRHNTHARLAGLRDKGLVREMGKRECSVTHETVTVWGLVPEGQQQEYRVEALRKKLDNARELVAKLEAQLAELTGQQ